MDHRHDPVDLRGAGILSGAALVFFAFLGFDVVATASEEAENPKRNVPLGIGVGLVLVVVLYMLVAIVTTGMVSYKDLAAQPDPSLATAFELVGATWAAKVISFGIVLGLATVIMVLLLGVTRVVFAMSRDGLLPRGLSNTGRHGTPVALQIIMGVFMATVAACFDISMLSDMVNIGTLSAFTVLHPDHAPPPSGPAARVPCRNPWGRHRANLWLCQPVRGHLAALGGLAGDRLRATGSAGAAVGEWLCGWTGATGHGWGGSVRGIRWCATGLCNGVLVPYALSKQSNMAGYRTVTHRWRYRVAVMTVTANKRGTVPGPVQSAMAEGLPYVIARLAWTSRTRRVDECPVDCIYEGARSLYMNPRVRRGGACEPVCPTEAIFYEDDLPDEWAWYKEPP